MHLLTILAQFLQISCCPNLKIVQHNSMVASDVQLQTLDEDKHRDRNRILNSSVFYLIKPNTG